MFRPAFRPVIQATPEGCNLSLDLKLGLDLQDCQGNRHGKQLTCSCLTTGLLKSSVPVYVPKVTRKPPSMCSSRMLRSRSLARATRSRSSLRASRSCRVSRRSNGASWRSRSREPVCRLRRPPRSPRLMRRGRPSLRRASRPSAPSPRDSFVFELPMVVY